MNIELIVQNNNDGKIYDISDLIQDIEVDTEIEETPGKLTFDFIHINPNIQYISEGSPISLKVDNNNVFWGYVFKIGKKKGKVSLTAYDQLRYFKNKDTYVFSNLSCEGIFTKICKDRQIQYKVINGCNHILPERINDNKTFAEMIQYSFDKTLIDIGKWYFMRDNFGTLEMLEVSKQQTNLAIGDESLLIDYDYESSIDDDTYNQVKLVKENKETKKREIYIVKDSSNIKKWGLLQLYETVDEKANEAQIKEKAEQLLKHHNKPKRTLKLDCLGDFRVKVGCGVYLIIKDLENDIPYKKDVIVTKVTHSFKNCSHKMNLEVKIV